MKRFIVSFLFFILSISLINGQEQGEISATFAKKLGQSRAIKDIVKDPAYFNKKDISRKADIPKEVLNFGNKGIYIGEKFPGLPRNNDPLVNSINSRSGDLEVLPNIIIEGINQDQSSSIPPDINGDIGNKFYIETVNSTLIRIFNRDGSIAASFQSNTFWNEFNVSPGGDPIILFDEIEKRWVFTEFPDRNAVNRNQLLIAISDTQDPLGTWTSYAFQANSFPDYPKYGIWNNLLVVTTNERTNATTPVPIYAIDKTALFKGENIVNIQRFTVPRFNNGPSFQVITPVDSDGKQLPQKGPALIMRMNDDVWGNTNQDGLDIFELTVDFENIANSKLETKFIPTSPFNSETCINPGPNFGCIQQPNGVSIDNQTQIVMNRPNYRNFDTHESIVLNFTVVVRPNVTGIRWMELRREDQGEWTLYQEGTETNDDNHHRFMGGIAINARGDIGLAYNVASSTKNPSLAYTGRLSTDPLGEMTFKEFEFAEGQGSSNFGRFGDYASMSVDPFSEIDFWYAGEYIRSDDSWGSSIVSFTSSKDSIDLSLSNFNGQMRSQVFDSPVSISVQIKNQGLLPLSNFKSGLILNNSTIIEDDINLTSLASDSIHTHTFSQTIDLSEIRQHDLKAYVVLDNDQRLSNDTNFISIRSIANNDIEITNLSMGNSQICGDSTQVRIDFINAGALNLRNYNIVYKLNDLQEVIIPRTGLIFPDRNSFFNLDIFNIREGLNTLTIRTELPNGEQDQLNSNNIKTIQFEGIINGENYTLELLTDRSPEETTWELQNNLGEVLASGGPYDQAETIFTEQFCLKNQTCYTFLIKDSNNDGIIFRGVAGNYTIKDADGLEVASLLDPAFGSEERNDFCTMGCILSAAFDIENPRNGNDGQIIINAINSNGNAMYSINGGLTFQSSNIFDNLGIGDYQIVIEEGECSYTTFVQLGLTSISTLNFGESLNIFPNPSNGLYRIELKGLPDVHFLAYQLYSSEGKLLGNFELANYSGILQTQLGIYSLPDGVYFIRLEHEGKYVVRQIVKQGN